MKRALATSCSITLTWTTSTERWPNSPDSKKCFQWSPDGGIAQAVVPHVIVSDCRIKLNNWSGSALEGVVAGLQDPRPRPAQCTITGVSEQENVAPDDAAWRQRQRLQSLRPPPAGHSDAFGPQAAPQTPGAPSRTRARSAGPGQHARGAQVQLQQRPAHRQPAGEGAASAQDGAGIPWDQACERAPLPALDSLYAGELMKT